MDAEFLTILISLLAILGTCTFFMVIFAIIVVSAIFIFRRFNQINKDAGQRLAADKETFFQRVEPDLLPWQAGAIADLSSKVEYAGRSGLGQSHYRGTIQSLNKPEAAWLAFDLRINVGKGSLHLRSARYEIRLDFAGLGYKPVQIFENQAPFGTIMEGNIMQLLDVAGRDWGTYHQHKLAMGVQPSDYNLKPYYGPVEIDGKKIAELNRNPLLTRRWRSQTDYHPLFRNIAAELNDDQQIWLLALAGWELYNRIAVRG